MQLYFLSSIAFGIVQNILSYGIFQMPTNLLFVVVVCMKHFPTVFFLTRRGDLFLHFVNKV